ncbi:MAG: hypothetical protein ACTSVI_16330 [Promethearchaeota archaeon]
MHVNKKDLIFAPYPEFELEYISREKCECGSSWLVKSRDFLLIDFLPIKEYRLECPKCGNKRRLMFDTTSFSCKC